MATAEKNQATIFAFWFAVVLLFVLLGGYGREAIEWLLMKLYESFVQRNPVRI